MPSLPSFILQIAEAVRSMSGRAFLVGGVVRDLLMDRPTADYDIEVYGLTSDQAYQCLSPFGKVITVGQAFGVLKVLGLPVDISLPRRDNKSGKGHRGFLIDIDPFLDINEALRRRDLTINSMAWDPLTSELVDPYDGYADLNAKVLRATDARHFSEDPLRALRVAQFAARFEMTPHSSLIQLCSILDLSELSAERVYGEFYKLLLKGSRPSIGLEFLRQANLLRFFPELAALIDIPQDPYWHPEGDVWTHTLMVCDVAAALREGDVEKDAPLMFGALCHDFGKPDCTTVEEGKEGQTRIRSLGHEKTGAADTEKFLTRLRAPYLLKMQVSALVHYHYAPVQFPMEGAKAPAYRRLARKIAGCKISLEMLARVVLADQLGRSTEAVDQARATKDFRLLVSQCPPIQEFLQKTSELKVTHRPPVTVVTGDYLMAQGIQPGPELGKILAACRAYQDETGCEDPRLIVDHVLKTSG